MAEDCERAALIVTPREPPPQCATLAIDRKALAASGATALYREGAAWRFERSYPPGFDRPWASRGAAEAAAPAPSRTPARDATPREEDLEAGD